MSNLYVLSIAAKPVDEMKYLGLKFEFTVTQEETQDAHSKPTLRRVRKQTRLIGLRSLFVKRLRSRTIKLGF